MIIEHSSNRLKNVVAVSVNPSTHCIIYFTRYITQQKKNQSHNICTYRHYSPLNLSQLIGHYYAMIFLIEHLTYQQVSGMKTLNRLHYTKHQKKRSDSKSLLMLASFQWFHIFHLDRSSMMC